jgi:hypothetical protein
MRLNRSAQQNLIRTVRTVLTLQQMLPIVPCSLYHIHFSTSEEAIVLFFLTLALMQP